MLYVYNKKFAVIRLVFFLILISVRNSSETQAAGKEYKFKIYNGSEVDTSAPNFKNTATVLINGFTCGGVIIAPDAILTAAHCCTLAKSTTPYTKFDESETEICGGTNRINCNTPNAQVRSKIKKVVVHPQYYQPHDYYNEYDLGIVVLEKPFIEDGKTVASIKLPSHATPVGTKCELFGWGDTTCSEDEKNISLPNSPKHSTLRISSKEHCNKIFAFAYHPSHICAIDTTNNTALCKGDSGSGLFCGGRLVGIESMSFLEVGYPSIFANVYYCRNWIKNVLRNLAKETKSKRDVGTSLWFVNSYIPISLSIITFTINIF